MARYDACRNGGNKMNKIICDVCGTDYPETAAQCPICGCASVGAQTAAGNEAVDAEEKAAYAPVKGGRYSKSNVRKRLKANQIPYDPSPESDPEPEYEDDEPQEEVEEEEDSGSNRGLVVVVIILLLAIVAVATYIAISIFGVGLDKLPGSNGKPGITQTTTTAPTTEPTAESTDVVCTELNLSDVDVYLNAVGSVWKLTATPIPTDTTDQVVFTSSDENIVTVDEFGLITAVGTGEASIIVTCGDVTVECPVLCGEKDTETTEPTDPTDTTEPTDPTDPPEDFVLKFKSKDFTLSKAGATYKLYDGEVDAADITWTTDNEEVATIKDGVVTAVGNGRTRVYGEYGDQKVSCWVSCKLPVEEVTEPDDTTEPDATEPEQTATYAIRINGRKPNYGTEQAAEATIAIGEELNVKIVDEAGKRVDVEWTASGKGEVSIEGNTVIGEKAGTVVLTAEIGGQKLTCKFIVK